jgi:hypothetical protein
VQFGALALALALALQNPPTGTDVPDLTWTDDKPFERILHNLAHDVRSLPSLETAAILAVGTAGAIALHPVDHRVSIWVQTGERSSYSPVGKHLGDGWVQGAAAIGAYTIGRLSHDAKTTHIGSDLIRGQVLTGLVTQGLKVVVGRSRPSGGNYSFPSGHSSAAFTSAAILHGHFGWRIGVPVYAISGFIAWARFRDNSHWVSDVVFGSAIGIAVGHTVVADHQRRSWTVVPTATKGGGALFFIKR